MRRLSPRGWASLPPRHCSSRSPRCCCALRAAPGFGLEAARWGHGLKLARRRRRRATVIPDWEIDNSLTDEHKERRRELARMQKQLEQREADTRASVHSTPSPPDRRKAPRRLETLEMTDSRPSTPPHVPDAALRAEVLAELPPPPM